MHHSKLLLFAVGVSLLVGACASDDIRPVPTEALGTVGRPLLATPSSSPSVSPSSLASPSPSPSAVAAGQTYTVKSGDTLTTIAEQFYGDASRWQVIFEANRDTLPSPNSLAVGMVIRIPPAAQR